MQCLCDDCRRAVCSKRWEIMRQTFFSIADGRLVVCEDQLPTYQAFLTA
jgi:hypothetical protein